MEFTMSIMNGNVPHSLHLSRIGRIHAALLMSAYICMCSHSMKYSTEEVCEARLTLVSIADRTVFE